MHCPNRIPRPKSTVPMRNTERRMPRLLSAKDIRASLRVMDPVIFRSRYAYFTLVSSNFNVPEALLLAWSLKRTDTGNDCVAMVVPDIRGRNRSLLRKIFDRVVEVDVIKPRSIAPQVRYLTAGERVTILGRMTKCNALKFIEYEKILFVESSCYILKNIDEIFQLKAPAGISSLVDSQSQSKFHGMRLSTEHVTKSLELSYGIRGHMLLLSPNLSMYYASLSNKDRHSEMHFIQPDVVFLTKLFRSQWTHIHYKFAIMPWQANAIKDTAYGVYLESLHPWDDGCDNSDDVVLWRQKAVDMCTDLPQVTAAFKGKRWFSELQGESRKQLKTYSETSDSSQSYTAQMPSFGVDLRCVPTRSSSNKVPIAKQSTLQMNLWSSCH